MILVEVVFAFDWLVHCEKPCEELEQMHRLIILTEFINTQADVSNAPEQN